MSYTHDRDITLEGWIVHTSQANAKGTIKEHRNPILESRCKSKRQRKPYAPRGCHEVTGGRQGLIFLQICTFGDKASSEAVAGSGIRDSGCVGRKGHRLKRILRLFQEIS